MKFRKLKFELLVLGMMSFLFAFAAAACAQTADKKKEVDHSKMDHSHMGEGDKMQKLNADGEKAMGFSQTATTHHFLIYKDGGAIQVEANDAADTANRDRIRNHLTQIAAQFTEGIFKTPFAVHGKLPDGAAEMEKLKADIKYTFEETPAGARVRIWSANKSALAAIHSFLKFQINEHQTGDPTTAPKQ